MTDEQLSKEYLCLLHDVHSNGNVFLAKHIPQSGSPQPANTIPFNNLPDHR